MRSNWLCATAFLCALIHDNALAFSSNGHETVGAIADTLLVGSRAEREVQNILGEIGGGPMTLQQAAVWPDCARGVHPQQGFVYDPGHFRDKACAIFEDDAGIQAMIDYVKRNNSNCEYSGQMLECHKPFHFADIAIKHNDYKMGYVGTNDHDIVHAIAAAIAVLEGKPCPVPFDIANKKEALMLLAHFIGDLHQPLHVGAVYLSQDGSIIDPEKGVFDPGTATLGGNSITGAGGNLHYQWDETKYLVDDSATVDALAAQAKAIKEPAGNYSNWPTTWAGDTIKVTKKAFVGVSFGKKTADNMWPATFGDRKKYLTQLKAIQKQQVIKGGARLAELLRTIWPD